MPRMDRLMTPERRQRENREIRVRDEELSRNLRYSYVSTTGRYTWSEAAGDPWYVTNWILTPRAQVVWDAIEEDPDRQPWRTVTSFPQNVHSSCQYCGGSGEGCRLCRPDIYTQCGCGATLLVGTECSCWFSCYLCDPDGQRRYQENGLSIAIEDNDGCRIEEVCSPECAERHDYERCADSGCMYMTDTDREDGLCPSCQPCECGFCYECGQRYSIRSYSYKPAPLFKGEGPLYLGLENEIDFAYGTETRDVARYILDEVGDVAYLKSDGSLNYGFELVTHPMALRWAMDRFPWHMYDKLRDEFGITAMETTGIHVHASRKGFSGSRHLYMWFKFFNRNANQIRKVSRRPDGQWSRFDDGLFSNSALYSKRMPGERVPHDAWYLSPPMKREAEASYRRWGYTEFDAPTPTRYSAINVQNEHTIEVRTFAGSVHAPEVMAALQLVHGTIEYARTLDAASVLKKSGWSWDSFTAWTSGQSRYEVLNSEIERLVN